jgi:hypothetical protein
MEKKDILHKLKSGITLDNIIFKDKLSLHSINNKESAFEKPIIIKNSDLGLLEMAYLHFNEKIELINCKIKGLHFQSIFANNGLIIKDCTITDSVDMSHSIIQKGNNEILISNNIFKEIVSFSDTDFNDKLIFSGNTFNIGCDINTEKQLCCYYSEDSIINNNVGSLNISEKEEQKQYLKLREKNKKILKQTKS